MQSNYYTASQVTQILGISRVTLWHWEQVGYLKPYRFGRSVYYLISDIQSLGSKKPPKFLSIYSKLKHNKKSLCKYY